MNAEDLTVLKNHTDELENHTNALIAHTAALKDNNEKLGSIHNILTDIKPYLGHNVQAMEALKEEITKLKA